MSHLNAVGETLTDLSEAVKSSPRICHPLHGASDLAFKFQVSPSHDALGSTARGDQTEDSGDIAAALIGLE